MARDDEHPRRTLREILHAKRIDIITSRPVGLTSTRHSIPHQLLKPCRQQALPALANEKIQRNRTTGNRCGSRQSLRLCMLTSTKTVSAVFRLAQTEISPCPGVGCRMEHRMVTRNRGTQSIHMPSWRFLSSSLACFQVNGRSGEKRSAFFTHSRQESLGPTERSLAS